MQYVYSVGISKQRILIIPKLVKRASKSQNVGIEAVLFQKFYKEDTH